jgi:hypothetical protein
MSSDAQNRMTEYLKQVRAYAQSPSLMAGLTLDESSTRLRQVSLTELKSPALARCLEQMRLAIGKQDESRINALAAEMEALLRELEGADPRRR